MTIPTFFGIYRDSEVNLLATPYLMTLDDLDQYHIEMIIPEYIDGYQVPYNTGNSGADAKCAYSVTDVSKYDYVLAPVAISEQNSQWNASGLNAVGLGSPFNERCVNIHKGTLNEPTCAWGLMLVDATHFMLIINTLTTFKVPFIGLKHQ